MAGALRLQIFLAVRNLRRQLRGSLSALLTIAAGVAALLLAEGYSAGMFSAFRDSAIRAEYGHLQLTLPGFHESGRSDPDAYRIETLPEQLRDALPEGTVVAPRFLLYGLVSVGDTTLPFGARAVDPAADSQGGAALRVLRGQRLAASDSASLLLGAGLAERLQVDVGERVVLLVTTAEEQLNALEATVAGVVASASQAADDALIIMPLELAHALMRTSGSHQLLLFLRDERDIAATRARLQPLADAAGLELHHWYDLAEFYRRAEALFREQLAVVLALVAAILLLSIGNTMMMAVLERTREVGTVMALGARPRRVMGGFLVEGALLGICGVLAGIVLAIIGAAALAALAIEMPPPPGFSVGYTAHIEFTADAVLRIALLSWAASVLASLLPAWRASRFEIVDALRVVR